MLAAHYMEGFFDEYWSRALDLAALSELLSVELVPKMLNCSTRHVRRLADAGRMPAPVRLGALIRWSRQELVDWIAKGCPTIERRGQAR